MNNVSYNHLQKLSKHKLHILAYNYIEHYVNKLDKETKVLWELLKQGTRGELPKKKLIEKWKSVADPLMTINRTSINSTIVLQYFAGLISDGINGRVYFERAISHMDVNHVYAGTLPTHLTYSAHQQVKARIYLDIRNPEGQNSMKVPKDGHIKELCKEMYDKEDFKLIGILTDALEDANANPVLLKHLRNKRQHYRGCWVMDKLLGKK